ncbi:MAG: nitroreductase family deazaflavin-dependent oxidoreductase [Deltaproteobacteria bacterium]|nr:nitroreductase family deazaflavin-dependent oxidoreductase [Deltaproteobacteria bacterium]
MRNPQQASGESGETRPSSSAEKEAFSSGGNRHMILLRGRWGLAIDMAVLWLTGYSLMTKQYALALGEPYLPTLLLNTTGARSGLKRTCALPYFSVGEDLVVRGSNGGGPTDPHWVWNVRKNPDARIRVRGRSRQVKAHVASGEERERLFALLCTKSPTTQAYQDGCAPRELPLVVLRNPEASAA